MLASTGDCPYDTSMLSLAEIELQPDHGSGRCRGEDEYSLNSDSGNDPSSSASPKASA
jgi:hypothetical protein